MSVRIAFLREVFFERLEANWKNGSHSAAYMYVCGVSNYSDMLYCVCVLVIMQHRTTSD